MSHYHVVVWIDHQLVRIYGLGQHEIAINTVKNPGAEHIHHKAGSVGRGAMSTTTPISMLGAQLGDAKAILVVGPAQAKTAFLTFLETHFATVAAHIVGVETIDRKSEGEVIAFAKRYFASSDGMKLQSD